MTVGGWQDRVRKWCPDREFFMRSQGQVRFITISSRLQIGVAAVASLLLLTWLLAMAAMTLSPSMSSRDRLALLNREARVVSAESRVASYREGIGSVAADLAQRQTAMEKLVHAHVGALQGKVKPEKGGRGGLFDTEWRKRARSHTHTLMP